MAAARCTKSYRYMKSFSYCSYQASEWGSAWSLTKCLHRIVSMQSAANLWDEMFCLRERSDKNSKLLWPDRKATVTQITALYHCGEQKRSSTCTTHQTMRVKILSGFTCVRKISEIFQMPTTMSLIYFLHSDYLLLTLTQLLDLRLHCTAATWLDDWIVAWKSRCSL